MAEPAGMSTGYERAFAPQGFADKSGDVAEQTADLLAQIDECLEMAATNKSKIVTGNV
ncbi:hypothetical protein ACFQFQ_30810 [Sulfitobacter porphyrae]|uniref:Uncharacterized protein n=1 Tax=Sulfitobacter porphyrae TaxID=1246864 RepID=A0ABW2BD55_9RHOB|nr:hypothetical protein GCM10007928_49590 [Sulfitobacter porphyrae]